MNHRNASTTIVYMHHRILDEFLYIEHQVVDVNKSLPERFECKIYY